MTEANNTACAVCKKAAGEDAKLLQCARCKNRCYCGAGCQKSDWDTHKKSCKRPNYLLNFHLCPEDIVDPPIKRTLSCPSTATFEDLHRALQVAFSWANTHTYDFKVKDPAAEAAWAAKEESMSQEESMMNLIKSLTSENDGSGNKQYLLRIVEEKPSGAPFTPFGGIPKVDRVHDRMRVNPNTPQKTGSKVRLFQVLDDAKYNGKPMEYEYDFGDCWCHDITLIGRENAASTFKCVDGEGHGCAEDVGSINGWAELKTAFRASRPNKELKDKMKWYKQSASNGDQGGLGNGRDRQWAKDLINAKLATMKVP